MSHRDNEISQKIESAMSHLAFSYNEHNIINGYLNAWISFEVLFNCVKKLDDDGRDKTTIEIISDYVPKISGLLFSKKLVADLGRDLVTLHGQGHLSEEFYNKIRNQEGGADEIKLLDLLRDTTESQQLLTALQDFVYVSYKTEYLIKNFSTDESLAKFIGNHEKSISNHLSRLYRVRNDLVHNASGILRGNLLNLSSISLLAFNIQEYTNYVIDQIIQYNNEHPSSSLKDVYEGLESCYDRLILRLKNKKCSSAEIIQPVT